MSTKLGNHYKSLYYRGFLTGLGKFGSLGQTSWAFTSLGIGLVQFRLTWFGLDKAKLVKPTPNCCWFLYRCSLWVKSGILTECIPFTKVIAILLNWVVDVNVRIIQDPIHSYSFLHTTMSSSSYSSIVADSTTIGSFLLLQGVLPMRFAVSVPLTHRNTLTYYCSGAYHTILAWIG